MKVKVCGLTNAADAAFAAAEGADYLGFVAYPPSPRHCGDLLRASREVRNLAVLVAVAEDAETILRMADAAGIRNIQPHVSVEHRHQVVQRLKSEGYFILLPWIEGQDQVDIPADLYVWESDPKRTGVAGGSGQNHAMAFPPPGAFLLAGGLDAENLAERAALCPGEARQRFQGFDAASRLELSPGIKDQSKVQDFIKMAKSMILEA